MRLNREFACKSMVVVVMAILIGFCHAGENKVKKEMGFDITSGGQAPQKILLFPARLYNYCTVEIYGAWSAAISKFPSQFFQVTVNDKVIFENDLVGSRIVTVPLATLGEMPVTVVGKMSTTPGTLKARGHIIVTCYPLDDDGMVVTKIDVDTKNATITGKNPWAARIR